MWSPVLPLLHADNNKDSCKDNNKYILSCPISNQHVITRKPLAEISEV